MKVRVRIAPSPTGPLHVGTARTALFNYLFARHHDGTFIVRIEDTDKQRSTAAFERQILEGLAWLGLSWDEGPDRGGEYGPYRQSERTRLYRDALSSLIAAGAVYPCYCSQEQLEAEREKAAKQGRPQVYNRTCRTLTDEERREREKVNPSPVFRFASQEEELTIHDLVRGDVHFSISQIGDFSIARGLDDPLYNFAVVVDDAAMAITHVIRGEDHLSNTPKQLLLYRALGKPLPQFAHIPLLLSPERRKLSKRDEVTSVADYRDQGYLPEALINFLALLGWNPKDEREDFTLDQLVDAFTIENVQKSGAIFELPKLQHVNAKMIRTLEPKALYNLSKASLADIESAIGHERLITALPLAQERAVTLNDLTAQIQFLATLPAYDATLLIPKKGTADTTKAALESVRQYLHNGASWTDGTALESSINNWIGTTQWSRGEVLWPLRVALTGQQHSPGVYPVAYVLGKDEVVRRISLALEKLT